MKRRYKLLLIIFISFILTIIIYILLKQNIYTYVKIGINYNNYSYNDYILDNIKQNKKYIYKDYNVNNIDDLIYILESNYKNINYYLKNANLVIIDLGTNELNNYEILDINIIQNYLDKSKKVINKISFLNKNVIYINYFNHEYIDYKLNKYAYYYDIKYLNRNYLKDVIYMNNKDYLGYSAHKNIYSYVVNNFLLKN